ncbi:hypothetical protein RIF29_18088 [Crotalaria pallida]|uniref:Uncharacterized protein n=1 Tax=Crotalaria pallida TaxID=3830 RepID=A0AAN9IFX1_CROPI
MSLQSEIKPGSPPILVSTNLDEMSVSELVSLLRNAFLSDEFDGVEKVLVARDAKFKAEIASLQVKVEMERLSRLQAEENLKKKEQLCQEGKKVQECYENLLKEVKMKNGLIDVNAFKELRDENDDLLAENYELRKMKRKWLEDSNAVTDLKMVNQELTVLRDQVEELKEQIAREAVAKYEGMMLKAIDETWANAIDQFRLLHPSAKLRIDVMSKLRFVEDGMLMELTPQGHRQIVNTKLSKPELLDEEPVMSNKEIAELTAVLTASFMDEQPVMSNKEIADREKIRKRKHRPSVIVEKKNSATELRSNKLSNEVPQATQDKGLVEVDLQFREFVVANIMSQIQDESLWGPSFDPQFIIDTYLGKGSDKSVLAGFGFANVAKLMETYSLRLAIIARVAKLKVNGFVDRSQNADVDNVKLKNQMPENIDKLNHVNELENELSLVKGQLEKLISDDALMKEMQKEKDVRVHGDQMLDTSSSLPKLSKVYTKKKRRV